MFAVLGGQNRINKLKLDSHVVDTLSAALEKSFDIFASTL